MEKKRRARINNCLNELKDLLIDTSDKDVSTSLCIFVKMWCFLQAFSYRILVRKYNTNRATSDRQAL